MPSSRNMMPHASSSPRMNVEIAGTSRKTLSSRGRSSRTNDYDGTNEHRMGSRKMMQHDPPGRTGKNTSGVRVASTKSFIPSTPEEREDMSPTMKPTGNYKEERATSSPRSPRSPKSSYPVEETQPRDEVITHQQSSSETTLADGTKIAETKKVESHPDGRVVITTTFTRTFMQIVSLEESDVDYDPYGEDNERMETVVTTTTTKKERVPVSGSVDENEGHQMHQLQHKSSRQMRQHEQQQEEEVQNLQLRQKQQKQEKRSMLQKLQQRSQRKQRQQQQKEDMEEEDEGQAPIAEIFTCGIGNFEGCGTPSNVDQNIPNNNSLESAMASTITIESAIQNDAVEKNNEAEARNVRRDEENMKTIETNLANARNNLVISGRQHMRQGRQNSGRSNGLRSSLRSSRRSSSDMKQMQEAHEILELNEIPAIQEMSQSKTIEQQMDDLEEMSAPVDPDRILWNSDARHVNGKQESNSSSNSSAMGLWASSIMAGFAGFGIAATATNGDSSRNSKSASNSSNEQADSLKESPSGQSNDLLDNFTSSKDLSNAVRKDGKSDGMASSKTVKFNVDSYDERMIMNEADEQPLMMDDDYVAHGETEGMSSKVVRNSSRSRLQRSSNYQVQESEGLVEEDVRASESDRGSTRRSSRRSSRGLVAASAGAAVALGAAGAMTEVPPPPPASSPSSAGSSSPKTSPKLSPKVSPKQMKAAAKILKHSSTKQLSPGSGHEVPVGNGPVVEQPKERKPKDLVTVQHVSNGFALLPANEIEFATPKVALSRTNAMVTDDHFVRFFSYNQAYDPTKKQLATKSNSSKKLQSVENAPWIQSTSIPIENTYCVTLALSETTALIGVPYDRSGSTSGDSGESNVTGAAYLYEKDVENKGDWNQVLKIVPKRASGFSCVGYAVAMDSGRGSKRGGALIAGGSALGSGTTVVTYNTNQEEWNDTLGIGRGDTLLVSVPNLGNGNGGSVHVYKRVQRYKWIEQAVLYPEYPLLKKSSKKRASGSKLTTSKKFGTVLAIKRNVVAVSDYQPNQDVTSVFVYEYDAVGIGGATIGTIGTMGSKKWSMIGAGNILSEGQSQKFGSALAVTESGGILVSSQPGVSPTEILYFCRDDGEESIVTSGSSHCIENNYYLQQVVTVAKHPGIINPMSEDITDMKIEGNILVVGTSCEGKHFVYLFQLQHTPSSPNFQNNPGGPGSPKSLASKGSRSNMSGHGQWVLLTKSDSPKLQRFGQSLSVSGNQVLVGSKDNAYSYSLEAFAGKHFESMIESISKDGSHGGSHGSNRMGSNGSQASDTSHLSFPSVAVEAIPAEMADSNNEGEYIETPYEESELNLYRSMQSSRGNNVQMSNKGRQSSHNSAENGKNNLGLSISRQKSKRVAYPSPSRFRSLMSFRSTKDKKDAIRGQGQMRRAETQPRLTSVTSRGRHASVSPLRMAPSHSRRRRRSVSPVKLNY